MDKPTMVAVIAAIVVPVGLMVVLYLATSNKTTGLMGGTDGTNVIPSYQENPTLYQTPSYMPGATLLDNTLVDSQVDSHIHGTTDRAQYYPENASSGGLTGYGGVYSRPLNAPARRNQRCAPVPLSTPAMRTANLYAPESVIARGMNLPDVRDPLTFMDQGYPIQRLLRKSQGTDQIRGDIYIPPVTHCGWFDTTKTTDDLVTGGSGIVFPSPQPTSQQPAVALYGSVTGTPPALGYGKSPLGCPCDQPLGGGGLVEQYTSGQSVSRQMNPNLNPNLL